MPAFDAGRVELRLKRSFYLGLIGKNLSRSLMAKRLAVMIGGQLTTSLSAYHALLNDWSEGTLRQIQRKFDAYANSYRAHVEGLVGDHASPAAQEGAIRSDLQALENARPE